MDEAKIMETLAKMLKSQNKLGKNQEIMNKKLAEIQCRQEEISKELGKILESIESSKKITLNDSLRITKEQHEIKELHDALKKKPTHLN